MQALRFTKWMRRVVLLTRRQREQLLEVSHYLPNYLGWRWAQGGERIASSERFLRAALGVFHTQR